MRKTLLIMLALMLFVGPTASASHTNPPDGYATLRVTWMVHPDGGLELVRTYQASIYDLANGCRVVAHHTNTDLTVSAADSGEAKAYGTFEGYTFSGTGLCYSIQDELTNDKYWYIEFRGGIEGSSAYSFHAETISQSALDQFL